MSDAKHTPGEWLVATNCSTGKTQYEIVTTAGATVAAGIDNVAAAALLAAAPELLEALKQCLPILAAHIKISMGEGSIAHATARTVISKAERSAQ